MCTVQRPVFFTRPYELEHAPRPPGDEIGMCLLRCVGNESPACSIIVVLKCIVCVHNRTHTLLRAENAMILMNSRSRVHRQRSPIECYLPVHICHGTCPIVETSTSTPRQNTLDQASIRRARQLDYDCFLLFLICYETMIDSTHGFVALVTSMLQMY